LIGIVFSRLNLILILLAFDFILFSISLLFIYTSLDICNLSGQVYAFLLLPVAVSETALGLALVSALYKSQKTIKHYGL